MIKARISAEMEAQLGDDAWAAQLLARLLQVHAYIYMYVCIYIYIYIDIDIYI